VRQRNRLTALAALADYASQLIEKLGAQRNPVDSSASGLTHVRPTGNTCGMKAAVSIPDDVFADADRLAKQLNTSRSQLYSRALKEFLARHAPDQVTDAMNRVCDDVTSSDDFSRRAARRVVKKVEW
jgi:hypothetical protein